ncbi:caspase-3-like, partial [Saccoglossus kowalevskii]
MEHPRRGCAIIINNKNFENMEQRNGTEVDAHSLKTTFDKLAFDVDEHTDLSKADMVATIKQSYYSWRDPVHGSWFIQSLCHVLQKYSETRSMQDMLTIVTNRVASLYETSNKQKKYDKKKQ